MVEIQTSIINTAFHCRNTIREAVDLAQAQWVLREQLLISDCPNELLLQYRITGTGRYGICFLNDARNGIQQYAGRIFKGRRNGEFI